MLDAVIRAALNNRFFVLAVSVLLLIFGIQSAVNLPIDVFPEITKPTVTLLTEAHGLAPEEVETRVTLPLENALNGLPHSDRIRSQSGVGLSVIWIEFDWGTDIYRSRQLVQERLSLAKDRLPRDITPTLGPVGSLMGQIQQIALYSETEAVGPMELRDLAEWTLRPRLMRVPGVAQVISIGGGLRQYQILISAEKLNRFQISVDQIDRELSLISQNTTGGFLDKGEQEFFVRHIGVVESVEDIQNTMVGLHFGRPVLIRDLAEVKIAPRLKRGDGSFNGRPAVVMTIQKQPGADTVQITRGIEAALEEMKEQIPTGVTINPDVFQQANFIEASIAGVQGKLKYGAVFVFVILFLFMAHLKMSLITMTAIPVSFLATILVFKWFGLSLNTMTLGGLAIAIGELVDDSIVDVENVFRRLRENALSSKPQPRLRVIFEASSEVRNSIVLATLIIGLVFLPLFSLSGLEGRLFEPLAVAYLTALMASLLVSLTLTPVLCFWLLKGELKEHKETRFVAWLKSWDRRMLEWALPRPRLILGSASLALLLSLALIPFFGRDFLPRFNEGTAMIALIANPGTSLAGSNAIGLEAEKLILEIPEVKSVSRRTGRAELDEHAAGVYVSELDLDFHPEGRPREIVLDEVRQRLKEKFPALGINVGQPIAHLIDHMLSGVSAALAIKIFGPDLATLRAKAAEVEAALKGTPGLVDLRVEPQSLVPQVKIQVLREEAAQFGLSPGEITSTLEAAFNGETVGQIVEGVRLTDVFYRFDDNSRQDLESMNQTVIRIRPDGRQVRVSDVADVYETLGPNEINRENGQRRIVISGNIRDRDLGSLIEEIRDRIQKQVELPQGYQVEYGGQFQNQQAATRQLLIYGILSLIGIAILLFWSFRSWAVTTQIMLTLPLAFIGGLIAVALTDRTLTVAGLVGFVTLSGLASRNAIMMISHYLHLMKYEKESFSKEMIIRGSQERLVPVLMTALVAALALLPLVFAKGQPGSEILFPVAVVIVGGLLSSTILDLIVTPVLFFRFGQAAAERALRFEEDEKV